MNNTTNLNTIPSTNNNKQSIFPSQQIPMTATSTHLTGGSTITNTNSITTLDESTRICTLCLRDCHNSRTNIKNIYTINGNGNHLTFDSSSGGTNPCNNTLNDSTLVCQSILSDYDECNDYNTNGNISNEDNNTNGGKSICGAIFHTSCCKIFPFTKHYMYNNYNL
ncbi:unnamed protein product [Heterobilharzia americana]|nr:unnamed protein product [Heterobilharzia americana]